MLRAEESNLLHAVHLARTHHLPDPALGCVQGLHQLYDLTGRATAWVRLVTAIQDDYIDPATGQPQPGREDAYSIVTGYWVQIAQARRDWPTATRLQTTCIAWNSDRATPYLDQPFGHLDPVGRNHIRNLATSEELLGRLLVEQDDPACLPHLRTAHDLLDRIGDRPAQARAAFNLGNAYLVVPGQSDLDQAQHWHQRSLELRSEQDRIGRAVGHGSLANVAQERFNQARAAEAPAEQLIAHLQEARAGHQQALDLLPDDHHDHRATAHNQLGQNYFVIGDVPGALGHYQQSIHHHEARGNIYGAGQSRFNIALLLAGDGRAGDALHYARAALTNYQTVGPGADSNIAETKRLVEELERRHDTPPL